MPTRRISSGIHGPTVWGLPEQPDPFRSRHQSGTPEQDVQRSERDLARSEAPQLGETHHAAHPEERQVGDPARQGELSQETGGEVAMHPKPSYRGQGPTRKSSQLNQSHGRGHASGSRPSKGEPGHRGTVGRSEEDER